jgi:hypothetical protein
MAPVEMGEWEEEEEDAMRAHMVCKDGTETWNAGIQFSLFHKKWEGVSRLLKVDGEMDTSLSSCEPMLGGTEHKGFV